MKIRVIAILSVILSVGFYTASVVAQVDTENNPISTSSLEFLKTPTDVADTVAATVDEMKTYEDVIPAPAPYGDRKFKMIPIKGGKFKMGSPDSEDGRDEIEGPQFEVEVKPFWMGETEVTWREFELYALKFIQSTHKKTPAVDPKRFSISDAMANPTPPYNIGSISYNKSDKDGQYPASGMAYYSAQAYCKWLTSVTGRYYRLPTEAEWEFACRAGTTTAYYFGDDDADIDDYAWTAKNCVSGLGYEKTKQKKPNAFGLYDMYGNVSEWTCQQYKKNDYADIASGKIKEGFISPTGNFGQVARGGSCDNEPVDCRSAKRDASTRDWKRQDPQFPQSIWWVTDAPYVGFRVVRPLTPPTEDELKLYDPNPETWIKYFEANGRQ